MALRGGRVTTKSASLGIGQLLRVLRAHDADGRTDGQLLERFLVHQDEAAFAALVRRHGSMVFGVCRRILGNEADSEDAFQATFLVLVRKAPSLTSRSILGDWLHGVARFTALKAKAAATHRRAKEQAMARPDSTAEEVRNDWLPVLDEELARLPEKYRLPIVLCDLEGKTRHEAAKQLGWPEGTVAGRLARARTMLAKALARRGVVFSGGALAVAISQNAASACVPGSLVFSTVKAASMSAAGKAVAGVVSAKVAALADGVMKAMLLTKLKTIAALVLILCVLGTGASMLTHHTLAAGQQEANKKPAPTPESNVPDAPAAKPKEDNELLQGTWHIVEVEVGGKHQAKETSKDQILVFTGDKLAIKYDDGSSQEMMYRIDPKQKPKGIDLAPIAGPDKGYTFKGIYEIDGDRLKLYYSRNVAPDAQRPARFVPEFEDRGMRSFVLKRAPAAKEKQPREDADVNPKGDAGQPVYSLSGHKDRIRSVAYSSDGECIASASWDGTIRLWDPKTGKEMRRLDVPPTASYNPAYLSQVLFSPDGEFVVVAQQAGPDEPGVIVWNRLTGKRLRDFPGTCAAISPDGKYIACDGWGTPQNTRAGIRLYEFATGKPVREIHSPYSRVELLVYSRDGKTLFASVGIPRPPRGDGLARLGHDPVEIRAWDVATGKERRNGLEGTGAWHIAVSPDGRTLALANSLRETATGGHRVGLIGDARAGNGVAFSPDGRTLAAGSDDGTVRLWDVLSGKQLGRFGKAVDPAKGGWVLAVAFSPDGRTLVSGGLDVAKGGRIPSTVNIWDVSRITGRARTLAERTPAELEADWKDLSGDAAKGYAALGRLVSSPKHAVSFLGKQLQSIKPVDAKRIERLIVGLDSDTFAVRTQASKDLEALPEDAVPALRKALAGIHALEAKRRLETLLDRLENAPLSADTVRQIRAIEALESIGNAEARRLLDILAAGQPEMRVTKEAGAATKRLAKPAPVAP
jgi:RNA polymerase sigma factor (sigma-70 family)